MQSIKPGMTRALCSRYSPTRADCRRELSVHSPAGTAEFQSHGQISWVGRPERDQDGRIAIVERENDIILEISPPYLEFSPTD